MTSTPARSQLAAAILLLAALAAGFHAPRLSRPFGVGEATAGVYCGPFVHNYRAFGFAALRGMPIGPQLLPRLDAGALPYRNHPPGIIWLCAWLGPAEWGMRLPGLVASVVAAIGLLVLVWPLLGGVVATLVAATFLGLPCLTLYTQVSYEPLVMAHGFWLWVATLRLERATGRARLAWRSVQIASAFLGAWMDWSIVFFCAALVPLVWRPSLAATMRRLSWPALAAGVGMALVLVWRAWALRGPLIAAQAPVATLGDLYDNTIAQRPSLVAFVERALGGRLVHAATVPVLVGGAFGLLVLVRRAPRLAIAAVLAGAPQPLIFAAHAIDHVHFFCYTASALALGAGGLALRAGRARAVAVAALVAIAATAWWTSDRIVRQSSTSFYADAGRVLSAATHNEREPRVPFAVVTNLPLYAHYIDTPRVVAKPMLDVGELAAARREPRFAYGYRYLWFEDASGGAAETFTSAAAPLAAFLAPFAKRRVPELEVHVQTDHGFTFTVREVYLVEVPPAFALVLLHAPGDGDVAAAALAALAATSDGVAFAACVPVSAADAGSVTALAAATHVVVLWSEELAERESWRAVAADALARPRPNVLVLRADAPAPAGIPATDWSQTVRAEANATAVARAVRAAFVQNAVDWTPR